MFAGTYDEQLSYDHNGNIKTLKRYGQTEQATPRLIDDLVYDYENTDKSNKLQKVTDSSTTLGFNDGNKTGNDYAYDVNGNLTKDLNKGITRITYNFLNLPTEVLWNGSKKINYAYNAVGVKLNKIVTDGTKVNKTEYLDGFQYKDGVLQFFPTTEGYVNAITAGTVAYNYVYNLTDHLGNVRVSYAWDEVNSKLKTVNEDHYYPFGLQHRGYTSNSREIIRENSLVKIGIEINTRDTSGSANYKYKYNGKELQDELNLNTYAYGWRDYDPAIGRFNKIDRFAEKYPNLTPYNYAANNPIRFVDVKGDSIWITFGNKNEHKVLYENGKLLNADGSAYNGKGVKIKKDGSLKITNSYLNSAVNSLNSISTTKEGSSMLSLLQSSTNNFSITNTTFNPDGDKNQYTPNSMANASFWEYMGKSNRDAILSTNRLSIGSGGTIYWSPTNELAGSLMTTKGINFNPTTNLGHELFHGLDSNFGLLSRSKTDGLFDREWRATYFENQLRNSLGAPARSQYNTSNGPVNLLNNNTNPRPLIEYMINTFSIFNR